MVKKRTLEEGVWEWSRQTLNSTHLLHRHSEYTATYGSFPFEKQLKTRWTAPPQQKIKGPHQDG